MFQHSRIAKGSVYHHRFLPKIHAFGYKIYMTWLDLDEVSQLDQLPFWSSRGFNLVQFRRSDYLRPEVPSLKMAIKQKLIESGCSTHPKRMILLSHLRNWGKSFNPVSFYICYDEQDQVFAILSQINNTPWDERHTYVHLMNETQSNKDNDWTFEFEKQFHVSPFMPMDIHYKWRFRLTDNKVHIHMQLEKDQALQFEARLNLNLLPITKSEARKVPFKFPLMTLGVVFGIYWQALLLWIKRIPFYSNPTLENTKKGEL